LHGAEKKALTGQRFFGVEKTQGLPMSPPVGDDGEAA
jgi:hypothetical protein